MSTNTPLPPEALDEWLAALAARELPALAEELGVLTLPTMLLLDAQGNVVDRNLVISDLEKKLEGLVGAN